MKRSIALAALFLPMLAQAQVFEELIAPTSSYTSPAGIRNGTVTGSYGDAITGQNRAFAFSRARGYLTFEAPSADPNNGTVATGSDDFGRISGRFVESNGKVRGFVRSINGQITAFDATPGPNATTSVNAMNGLGFTTGDYRISGDGIATPHGFVRTPLGILLHIQVPSSGLTYPWDINSSGAISGYYGSAVGEVLSGFIRSPLGFFTTFAAPPGCPFSDSQLYINDRGDVSGSCFAGGFEYDAFIRTHNGAMIRFAVPGATWTFTEGIASNGDIAGYYSVGADTHGFIRAANGALTTFDFPGSTNNTTQALGIDEKGNIIGIYYDEDFRQHAFIRYAQDL